MHNLELTDLQQKVLTFIKSFTAEEGFPPSRNEIRTFLTCRSLTTVQSHLRALERKQAISLKYGTNRGIKCLV